MRGPRQVQETVKQPLSLVYLQILTAFGSSMAIGTAVFLAQIPGVCSYTLVLLGNPLFFQFAYGRLALIRP